MHIELEDQLENICALATIQQGIAFSSEKEAQHYFKKATADIRNNLQQSSALLKKGLACLAEKNHGHVLSYVASVSAKLLKHCDSPEKFSKIIRTEIWSDAKSLLFFNEALEPYIDCGDPETEEAVIAAVMALFPLNPQPYIYFAALLERRDGAATAAVFYEKIIEVIDNPALYYFAAECFYQNGDNEQAQVVLHRALACIRQSSDSSDPRLEELIRESMHKI